MSDIKDLLNIMNRLRDPATGCPWDCEQSFASIAPYTIEEAYEVADAIARGDLADLKDELGDLLFQVVFHSKLASEIGAFDFNGVVEAIEQKLLRRHPHVFGEQIIETAKQQTQLWEALKEHERLSKHINTPTFVSVLDGVAVSLPALTRSVKLQQRAARVGFDWPDVQPVFEKVIEELDEVKQAVEENNTSEKIEEEIGDLMFSVSNLARHLGIDPEMAMRACNAKFERRFKAIELAAHERSLSLSDMTPAEIDSLYQTVKQQEQDAE